MSDLLHHLRATVRNIASRDHLGQPARVLTAVRTYNAPIEDVWDALTNGERIPRWFLPISGDLRVGGHYQFEGNAGGKILECDPPKKVAVTWGMHGSDSWVTVRLEPDPAGGTRLNLEHIAHVEQAMWDQFGPSGVGIGWDMAMMGLGEHLSKQAAVKPENAAAWMVTPEAKNFMRKSADAWADTAIAAGDEEAMARAASDRTYAMYTGEA